MSGLPERTLTPTAEEILQAFPEGLFAAIGANDSSSDSIISGWGSDPAGVTRVSIATGGIRIETSREPLPVNLLVSDLVFTRISARTLHFPLTLQVDHRAERVTVAGQDSVFETYVLDGSAIALGSQKGLAIIIRSSESALQELSLERLNGAAIEGLVEASRRQSGDQ